jgi:hypothetical protein
MVLAFYEDREPIRCFQTFISASSTYLKKKKYIEILNLDLKSSQIRNLN